LQATIFGWHIFGRVGGFYCTKGIVLCLLQERDEKFQTSEWKGIKM
jgi:energy-converting hydrogenase Eha subunit G